MTDARPLRPLPGGVRQNGYVVRDLDAAMASWLALGVGPWLTLRGQPNRTTYRGQPAETTLSIAFANSGDLQIELIAQDDDAPTYYREFLDAGLEGFHHLAYWVEDFDAALADVVAAGLPVVWSGDGGGAARFAYVEVGGVPATAVEIMELNAVTAWMTDTIREAAATWDGSEPAVRPLF